MAKDTNVTVTVDTANINQTNKKLMVTFSDDRNDPISIVGDPEDFESIVDKNQKITWTAVPLNGSTPVTIESVKREKGAKLLKQIARGNSENSFTAKIKNKDFDPPNPAAEFYTEDYSITVGLNGYEGIAGGNEHGALVFVGSQLAYMNNYQNNVWLRLPNAPFNIEGIAGDNNGGPIVYAGNQVAWMHMNGTSWNLLANAPFKIEGIAGNNTFGATVFSGMQMAYMDNYDNNTWVTTENAPFEIDGLGGDNMNGLVAYSGNQVAVYNKTTNLWEMTLPNAPFAIEGIASTSESGPVAYSGSQVVQLNFGSNVWQPIVNAPILIQGIAGDSGKGPIIFTGSSVYYLITYHPNPVWTQVANEPLDPKTFVIDPRLRMHK